MRFFNRSIFGLFLTVLTIGVLLIAVYVFKNAQDDREDRKRPRSDRERSFSVYVLPLKIESINPEVTVFGEVVVRSYFRITDICRWKTCSNV